MEIRAVWNLFGSCDEIYLTGQKFLRTYVYIFYQPAQQQKHTKHWNG